MRTEVNNLKKARLLSAVALALCAAAFSACAEKKATARMVLGYYAGDQAVVYHSVTAFTKYLGAVSVVGPAKPRLLRSTTGILACPQILL